MRGKAPTRDASIVGIVLAGGLSRRMGGGDKSLLDLAGRPMLSQVVERLQPQVLRIVLNANGDLARFGDFDLPVIADTIPGFVGPLAGVLAGLQWARHTTNVDWIATAPSDTPFLARDLVMRLRAGLKPGDDVVVARSRRKRHATIALWALTLADDLANWLANPQHRAIHDWLDSRTCSYVDFEDAAGFDPFFNVNTRDDLALAKRRMMENA